MTPQQETLYELKYERNYLSAGWCVADDYDEEETLANQILALDAAIDKMYAAGAYLEPDDEPPTAREMRLE